MFKKRKITKVLKALDVFGQPVQLYVKGKKLHKTTAGGIITLMMITILLILFFVSLINLIYKKNVNLQEQTSYEMIPPLLDINRDNFMFSFGPSDPTITQNNSIFSYQLMLITEINEESEEETLIIEQPINFGPCDPSDYKKFVDYKKVNVLTNTFCPHNFSFPIQGDEGDNVHSYINLNIVKCENGTHENITCASDEKIIQYFQDTQTATFNLYFVNRAVDQYDFDHPYKKFIERHTWTLSPLGSLTQISTISFRSIEIYSYNDIFGIQDPTIHKAVGFAQDETNLFFVPSKDTTTYFTLNLKSSNYKRICYRTYGTILEVISFIGGLFNLMHLFLGVVTSEISHHIFDLMMANRLYNFDLSSLFTDENKLDQASEIKEEHPPPLVDENAPSYWKSMIQNKFEKSRLLRTTLKYPTLEYAKNSLYCMITKVIKKKNKLFQMATQKISTDMDISIIMRKLQDIEKLKQILLTPEQLNIFNFIPSPTIGTKNSKQFLRKDTLTMINNEDTYLIGSGVNNLCEDLKQFDKHSRAYNELKKASNPINDKILACLSPDIKDILEAIEKSRGYGEKIAEENQDSSCQHLKVEFSLNLGSNARIV